MGRLPKIVAIEGLDGVGKESIARELAEVCTANGLNAKIVSFPRYDTKWGQNVSAYLQGEMGDPTQVDPNVAGALYTADRINYFTENPLIQEEADVLILDRSYYSNFIHQTSKFITPVSIMLWIFQNYHAELVNIPNLISSFVCTFYIQLDEKDREEQMKNRMSLDGHEKNVEYQKSCQAFIDTSKTPFFKNSLITAADHMHLPRGASLDSLEYYCGSYVKTINVKHVEVNDDKDNLKLDDYLNSVAEGLFKIACLNELEPKSKLEIDPQKLSDMSNALNTLEEASENNG